MITLPTLCFHIYLPKSLSLWESISKTVNFKLILNSKGPWIWFFRKRKTNHFTETKYFHKVSYRVNALKIKKEIVNTKDTSRSILRGHSKSAFAPIFPFRCPLPLPVHFLTIKKTSYNNRCFLYIRTLPFLSE